MLLGSKCCFGAPKGQWPDKHMHVVAEEAWEGRMASLSFTAKATAMTDFLGRLSTAGCWQVV